ncbi:hypothetical protein ACQJ9D_02570 [Helicobacter pylori]
MDNKVLDFISIDLKECSDIGIDKRCFMILALQSDENKDYIYISKDAIKGIVLIIKSALERFMKAF